MFSANFISVDLSLTKFFYLKIVVHFNHDSMRGIRLMKTITAICMMAILVAAAFSGCTEKKAEEGPAQETNSAAKEAGLGLQTANAGSFLDDFNSINDPYKKTLFATGQGQRNESINYYENLTDDLASFQEKYGTQLPPEIKSDKQFSGDMMNASAIIARVKDEIYTGNLTDAHKKLEEVRPIFQKILTRNGLLPLSVALVDFHDTMELMLDAAGNKESAKVLEIYPKADEKLRVVESISSDPGIKAIRANLDDLMNLAKENKTDELPAKADDLKASYVRVYLATG